MPLSRFLTAWLTADAVINIGAGVFYLASPGLFFDGIGGPPAPQHPNVLWTTRTLAAYMVTAGGAMALAARCARLTVPLSSPQ
ncbi:hypothetical protein PUNSTDRAFT_130732 [Punctularia strigosozonata HHB-11173 SS5]|uniref:uncharacterized protein n=1 Tax=Punctularia strigosozonata (strain HHB-11173) TaxID=741275 RepID=UPI0004416CC0|nr:uncharacterized protein PUNSTDRAFT_130732 [Punctularia strigosozonata HHB-11173 SS5]EIN12473.1 hypothetical protein PUNSTDRAFT_130732 [Punctularia strigosozonata HHB-11173 SS5]